MSDITVDVETQYIASQSSPKDLRFVFTYEISITNHGKAEAQLISREWRIQHGEMRTDSVTGEGVVGKTPWIQPGKTFTYKSGAILETSFGAMTGKYTFRDRRGNEFDVQIEPFLLVQPSAIVN